MVLTKLQHVKYVISLKISIQNLKSRKIKKELENNKERNNLDHF